MKRFGGLFILALTLVLTAPVMAQAEGTKPVGVYVGGHLGMSIENFSGRKMNDVDSDYSWSPSSKTDSAFSGGVVLGYDFDPRLNVPVRVELDYTARSKADVKNSRDFSEGGNPYSEELKHKVGLQTLMLNTWVDIPTGTAITPYLGGGIGFAFIDYTTNYNISDKGAGTDNESNKATKNKTNFAWSLGGGVAYDVTERWTVDLGYRYIDAGKVKATFNSDPGVWAKSKTKVQTHDIQLGVRYTF